MQIKTDGIVIKQQKINDNDRYLTILTRDNGVIRAYANSVCGIKSSMCSSTALMSYSDLVINESKGNYRVVSADLKKAFFKISEDIVKISLASYLFEITSIIGVPDSNCEQLLRLLLNTLYFLEQGGVDPLVLKTIFELRSLVLCGYAPQLYCSCESEDYAKEQMWFSVKSGELICNRCIDEHPDKYIVKQISVDMLRVMEYINYLELKDVFKIRLSSELALEMTKLTEEFCSFQLEKQFDTLNFFYSVI